MKKIKLSTFEKLNNVTQRTVWNWMAKGLVNFERTLINRILILVDEDNPTIKKEGLPFMQGFHLLKTNLT